MILFSSVQRLKLMATLITSGLLSLPFLGNGFAQAQIGVSPLVIETQAQRGQAQGILTIRNPTTQASRARIYSEAFTYDRETGFQVLAESEQDLSPYLRFSPREMTIPPGESRQVRFIAQLPPDIEQGEYRTVLFTETLIEATDEQQNLVGIQARIGATVYVRVGDVAPNLSVEEAHYDVQEQDIELLTQNSGKASARVAVNWRLSQEGNLIAEGEMPATSVIAERDRVLSLVLPEASASLMNAGTYQLSGELMWTVNQNQETLPFEIDLIIGNLEGASSGN